MSSTPYHGDPWERVGNIDSWQLAAVLEHESNEVAAVILSKLKVSKAGELLGMIPGECARAIAYGVPPTGTVAPDVVFRIGVSLVEEMDTAPARAFTDGPVDRVGAILNMRKARYATSFSAVLNRTMQSSPAKCVRLSLPSRLSRNGLPTVKFGRSKARSICRIW